MAVSGNADIFSINVDSRLKTILIYTEVAAEMNFSSALSSGSIVLLARQIATNWYLATSCCIWVLLSCQIHSELKKSHTNVNINI